MPHLDDGILHAYMDGALEALAAAGALPDGMQAADVVTHLEHCADCRGRLNLERQTRERAGAVLRDAAPYEVKTPSVPPAAGGATSRGRRTYLPYAWAASLLLAVGAGWWGSQISRDPRAAGSSGRTMETDAMPDAMGLRPPPAPAGAAAQAGAPASDERAARDVATPAAQPTDVAGRGPERAPSSTPAAGRPADVADRDRDEIPPAPPPPAGRAADAVGRLRADIPQVPAAPAQPVTPRAETTFAAPESVSSAARTVALQFLARDSAGLVQWRPAPAAEQLQIDSVAFAFAGADIVARDVARELGVRAVRVRQFLAGGEEVEVLTWRLERITLAASIVESAVVDSGAARRTAVRAGAPRQQRARMQGDSARRDPRPAAAEKVTAPGALTLLRAPLPLPNSRQETVFGVAGEDVVVVVRAPLRLSVQELAAQLRVRH